MLYLDCESARIPLGQKGGRTRLYLVGLERLHRESDAGATLVSDKDWEKEEESLQGRRNA